MKYLYSKDPKDKSQSLAGWLLGINASLVHSVHVQSGYFSDGGLELIKPLLEGVKYNDGEAFIVVGANDKGTSEEDAQALLQAVSQINKGRCGLCVYGGALFHPKVIHIGFIDGSSAAYVGSANLTEQGALRNLEAALVLSSQEDDPAEVLDSIKASVQDWFFEDSQVFYELNEEVIKRLVKRNILGKGRVWRAGPADGAADSVGRKGPRRAGREHTFKRNELKRALATQRKQFKSIEPSEPSTTKALAKSTKSSSSKRETVQATTVQKTHDHPSVLLPVSNPLKSEALKGDQISYELNEVSFNLNYIPHPDQAYWMMETQVTQALYRAVTGKNPSWFEDDQLPVECVSWEDGIAFCNALSKKLGLTPAYKGTDNNCELVSEANGFRLPFEAEWEFAAKGGQSFKYAGSDNLKEVGWYGAYSSGNVTNRKTQPIAQLKPNSYGLYDMMGNVWEWCADDPSNPGQHRLGAYERVLRGGGWSNRAGLCEVSIRDGYSPVFRIRDLGLRLSRSLG